MARGRDKPGPREEEQLFVEILKHDLESSGWTSRVEPSVSHWEPDLVLEAPTGNVYVIEVKLRSKAVDFSTVDYLLNVADAIKTDQKVRAKAILISSATARGTVATVAEQSGMVVLSPEGGPDQVARALFLLDGQTR
jgi:hypothetical protein